MKRPLLASLLATILLVGAQAAAASSEGQIPGLPASVESVSFSKRVLSYPTLDAAGVEMGSTTWRVVRGTGNCCENHLGATKTGRLFDFGGAYLNFSDDLGVTWKRVRPIEPLVGPEGTVVTAPGGDVLGVTWDPYTGDRVLAFKYEAATDQWQYMYEILHTPFYDREWIAVVPGPFTIGGQTVPYITVLRGGFPSKDVWYYSLDGLHYTLASNKALMAVIGGTSSRWLPSTPDPDADWTQPISESSIAPLNGGGALAYRVDDLDNLPTVGGDWWTLEPGSLLWSRFTLEDGSALPSGRLAMDSRGWTHLLSLDEGLVTYRLSSDGGRTWQTSTVGLPPGSTVEDWDFRANGALGMTAVAVHAHKESGTDQDYLLKYSTACGAPDLYRTHLVGNGDLNASSGFGASIRFDFATTVILPDGRVATSLLDAAHRSPALAVEMEPDVPAADCPAPG